MVVLWNWYRIKSDELVIIWNWEINQKQILNSILIQTVRLSLSHFIYQNVAISCLPADCLEVTKNETITDFRLQPSAEFPARTFSNWHYLFGNRISVPSVEVWPEALKCRWNSESMKFTQKSSNISKKWQFWWKKDTLNHIKIDKYLFVPDKMGYTT